MCAASSAFSLQDVEEENRGMSVFLCAYMIFAVFLNTRYNNCVASNV